VQLEGKHGTAQPASPPFAHSSGASQLVVALLRTVALAVCVRTLHHFQCAVGSELLSYCLLDIEVDGKLPEEA